MQVTMCLHFSIIGGEVFERHVESEGVGFDSYPVLYSKSFSSSLRKWRRLVLEESFQEEIQLKILILDQPSFAKKSSLDHYGEKQLFN